MNPLSLTRPLNQGTCLNTSYLDISLSHKNDFSHRISYNTIDDQNSSYLQVITLLLRQSFNDVRMDHPYNKHLVQGRKTEL